jgi:ABC-type polysaccharide/polyol phosphate transport system ATPase subunit
LKESGYGFRTNCTEKLNIHQSKGNSIIFASHFYDEAERICEKAILLEHERIVQQRRADQVYTQYRQLILT